MKKVLFSLSALAAIALFLPSTAAAWGHMCAMGGPMACGPMMPPPAGTKVAHLLVAMAAGYGVLVLAVRQSRKLSLFGLVLGWFIIAVAAAGIGCVAGRALCLRCHRADACVPAGACPFMSGRTPCDGAEKASGDDGKAVPAKTAAPSAPAKTDKKK